jgi:predicted KAP-like P-loop ATPase
MWNDLESTDDYLGHARVAGRIAKIVLTPNSFPTTIGLFGGWGAGKSTVLDMVGSALGPEEQANPILLVRFDA